MLKFTGFFDEEVEVRCTQCDCLLLKCRLYSEKDALEIKCRKCGTIVLVKGCHNTGCVSK